MIKMNKKFRYQWLSFIRELALKEELSAIDLLGMLLQLLKDCGATLSDNPFFAYGLTEFILVKQEDCPIQFTSFSDADVPHFKDVAATYAKKPDSTIASFLRFTLEEMLVVESDRDCPRCGSGGMGIFKSGSDGRLALMCKHCGHGVYLDGSKMAVGALAVPTTTDLRNAALIPS